MYNIFNIKTISILFVTLLLSASTYIYAAKRYAPVGAVVAYTGDVFVYHKEDSLGVTVSGIEGIFPNDLVVTTEGARAKILFNDDSVLSIGEDSRLEVKEFELEEKKHKRVARLKLSKGKLRALVARRFSGEGSKFEVETKTAVAEVRGTEFIMSITESGTEVVTISGTVYVRSVSSSIKGEVVLEAGSGTTVRHAWALDEPVSVPEERIAQHFDDTDMPVTALVQLKESGCVGCHLDTFMDMNKKKFVHPGAKRDCKRCHIKQLKTGTEKEIPIGVYARDSFVFLDLNENTSYSLRIRVKDRAGKEALSSEVRFVPATVSKTIYNDNRPPQISDLKVAEIRAGIFYSATLVWNTDEYSTSTLEYGLPGTPGTQISNEAQYVTDHRMTVGGLFPGKVYVFRAIARDPFGTTFTSGDLKMEVKNPFAAEMEDSDTWPAVRSVRVVKIDKRTALTWKSNKETIAFLNLGEVMEDDGGSRGGPHSPGFVEFQYRGIYACLSEGCHKGKIHRKWSHPTGKLLWTKVKVPVDLPIFEGNVMLCVTCHTPHSGDHKYRLRKVETRLCNSCHADLTN